MGMFSFLTADTEKSISNVHSVRGAKTVYLLQPNGKKPIKEERYDGYGDFGPYDCFVWLVEHNAEAIGVDPSSMSHEEKRSLGIDLFFDRSAECVYPLKFSFNENAVYEKLEASGRCPHQGFFYGEFYGDDDEEDEWD